MSTVSELVSFVRDVMELDEADLSTSLIKQYMKDGYNRIISLERRWPFFEVSATLNAVSEQRDYPISSIGAGNFREVISILDTSTVGNRLSIISMDDAEGVWHGAFDQPARPLFFAEWGDVLKLYPKPNMSYALSVRGYRKPTYTWINDSALQIDCDERLHDAIAYYAIAQAYKRQEDTEMHAQYKQSFDEAVGLARKDIMRPPSHRPMIVARGVVRPSDKFWLESLGRTLGQ